MHDIGLFFIISAVLISFSIVITFLSRKIFSLRKLTESNEGFSRANIGVLKIYAFLVGFAIYSLSDSFHKAESTVHHEANTLKNIYIYSKYLPTQTHFLLADLVKNYAQTTIKKEWPKMVQGQRFTEEGDQIIEKMRVILYNHPKHNQFHKSIISSILEEIKNLKQDRDDRMNLAIKKLRQEISVAVFFISFLCIFLTSLTGIQLNLHLISSISVALTISCTLFLIVALDKPFSGPFSVEPDPFQQVLTSVILE